MPKIFLKPQSPEFADTDVQEKVRICDNPMCRSEGEFKAPKHRGLNEYYFFCLEHVRDYNRKWNYFSGIPEDEVERMVVDSLYGDRPTWRYDQYAQMEEAVRDKIWQTYHFSEEAPPHKPKYDMPPGFESAHSPEFKALAVMDLAPPVEFQDIRERYKTLAKKHHPDRNQGCKHSEELLKHINMAYMILRTAFEKFKDTSDR